MIFKFIKSMLFFPFLPPEFFTADKKIRLLVLSYLCFINFFQFSAYFYFFHPIEITKILHENQLDFLMFIILMPSVLFFPLFIPFSLMNKHIIQIGIRIIEKKTVLPRMFGVLCLFFVLTFSMLNVYLTWTHICK